MKMEKTSIGLLKLEFSKLYCYESLLNTLFLNNVITDKGGFPTVQSSVESGALSSEDAPRTGVFQNLKSILKLIN